MHLLHPAAAVCPATFLPVPTCPTRSTIPKFQVDTILLTPTAGGSRNANSADSAMLSKRNIRSELEKSAFKYTTDQDYSSSLSAGDGDPCLSSLSSGSRSQKMASSRLGYACKVSKKFKKKNPLHFELLGVFHKIIFKFHILE